MSFNLGWFGRILAALEALFGGKADEREVPYNEGMAAGQQSQQNLDNQKALQDAQRQAQAFADRPTNDDEFADRLRRYETGKPRRPDRASGP